MVPITQPLGADVTETYCIKCISWLETRYKMRHSCVTLSHHRLRCNNKSICCLILNYETEERVWMTSTHKSAKHATSSPQSFFCFKRYGIYTGSNLYIKKRNGENFGKKSSQNQVFTVCESKGSLILACYHKNWCTTIKINKQPKTKKVCPYDEWRLNL